MSNPQKQKGSAAERAVVSHLQSHGWPYAERRLAGATKDRGDVAGVPGIVIEVKDCARSELPGWLDEAHLEAANDHADYGVVWHKRRGRGSAGDWFVTMSGADFTRLLAAAGYGGTRELVSLTPAALDSLIQSDHGRREAPSARNERAKGLGEAS